MASVRVQTGDTRWLLDRLPGDRFEAVLTRPPVGHRWRARGWHHPVPPPDIWQAVRRLVRPGGWLMALTTPEAAPRLATTIEDAGWWNPSLNVWLEGLAPRSMPVQWAPVVIARNLGGVEPGWEEKRHQATAGPRWKPGHIWAVAGRSPAGERARPPERIRDHQGEVAERQALYEWLIDAFVPQHGDILDPFCGTGETALATVTLGRGWHGIETDLGASRMAVEMAQKAVEASPFEPRI